MRNWSKGELQALGLASNFLVIAGLLTTIAGGCMLAFTWRSFVEELPGSLLGVLTAIVGIALFVGGIRITLFTKRYEKETGKSAVPFSEDKDANKKVEDIP